MNRLTLEEFKEAEKLPLIVVLDDVRSLYNVGSVFCGTYIKLQSDVTARMKAIARLESQITDLKADNDEAYKRINTTIDLDGIRNTAINELGMFYATEDQIVYYSVDRNDYMNQYTEIPQK